MILEVMETIKIKNLPNPKNRDLIPPDMDYIYFEGCECFHFEPEKEEYSPANAWWLSECAFLAYCHPGFARMAYKLAGFNHFRFFQGVGTECMVSWNDQSAIVSFRGTELKSLSALHEIRTDLNAVPVSFPEAGKVHRGFLRGLEEVWAGEGQLKEFLNKLLTEDSQRPLWITGHSLGGALAALCFARIPEAKGLYIYGAPRVGDAEFVDQFKGRCAWRIENSQDPVPMVPPDIPSVGFNFKDIGNLKFLNWDGKVLDRRPEFILSDHKTKYLDAKTVIDNRIKEINTALVQAVRGKEGSGKVRKKISEHLNLTKKEWKSHMDGLFNEYGLKVDEHQPIFYTVKLWNALLASQSDDYSPE